MIIHNSHLDLERTYLRRTVPFIAHRLRTQTFRKFVCDRTLYKNVHVSGMEIYALNSKHF